MKKQLFLYLFSLTMLIISCKKDPSKIDQITNVKEKLKRELDLREAINIDTVFIKGYHQRVSDFYKKYNYKTVWNNKKDRKEYLDFLSLIDEDGLEPNDYFFDKISTRENKYESLSEQTQVELDILYTQSFFRLANNIHSGKLSPRALYNDWEITPEKLEPEKLLFNSLYENKISKTLDSLRPQNILYGKLKNALYEFKKTNPVLDFKQKQISIKSKIVLNDTNDNILDIKQRLSKLKLYKLEDSLTNIYNEELEISVKKFQIKNNLIADGVIGLGTVKAMNYNKNHRKAQIIANLERLRWFPRDLGENYVLVNIPGFELWMVSKNDTIHSHKVVVGKNSRRTPILSSKFSDIVFNPTWTVPPTIIKNDLTPSASRNINYFSSNKITIYKNGNIVDPENWDATISSSYRYVQSPGTHNSLGLIKFNFPNNHMVYLHDTNNRSVFGRGGRDLSSGCIRVESPVSLATKIFRTDGNLEMNEDKILKIIKEGKTRSVKIKTPIFIHQFYWTVSVDKDGGLKYNTDIYNLDIELYEALRK